VSSELERVTAALQQRYEILREIGRGGMGMVHLARDCRHGRRVALKLLPSHAASSVGEARFLREVAVAANLQHPHLVPVYDSGAADGYLYYVMPYIEGESLRDRLLREQRLSCADALRIADQVLDALAYAHQQGVVHRDIKPENILLQGDHALVCDFGIARWALTPQQITATGALLGSPQYMSPEQARGAETDSRSDLYSLGCVLFEMLTGQPPFIDTSVEGLLHRHRTERPRSLDSLRPDTPPRVCRAVGIALAKSQSNRFGSAAEFRQALASGRFPRRIRWNPALRVMAGVALVAAAGMLGLRLLDHRVQLDPNLVVIAPFDVLAPGEELWREGMVDVLARSLDGAGPLRTVSPTVALAKWNGRADPASAISLARHTGAGVTLLGQLVKTGPDSLRLDATLINVVTRESLGEIRIAGHRDRIDRLADSLAVAALQIIAQTRALGAVHLTSLGSGSIPALKAFLRGEQFYRRGLWDSAAGAYQRAVAQDSDFAPAIRRLGNAYTQIHGHGCFIACEEWALMMRAGARNHGLAPRESLLIAIDSLYAALLGEYDLRDPSRLRRLFVILQMAVREYPRDPEVWYVTGEAQNHLGIWPQAAVRGDQALQSFERSIALDSGFAPAYSDAVTLTFRERGYAEAMRIADRYLSRAPQGADAAILRLVNRISRSNQPSFRMLLDTLPRAVVEQAIFWLLQAPDSAETALAMIRAYYDRVDAEGDRNDGLAYGLTARGHTREAAGVVGTGLPQRFADLALAGLVPPDTVARVFSQWLEDLHRKPSDLPSMIVRWWADQGDTVSLQALIQRADSEAADNSAPWEWSTVGYDRLTARAYLALARRDTLDALRRFLALPDSLCLSCQLPVALTTVQLLTASGRYREAASRVNVRLEQAGFMPPPLLVLRWTLERARVNDRLGDRDRAIPAYRFVATSLRHADPELQPWARESETALLRLGN
jgi:serine/threonine-protein kinase